MALSAFRASKAFAILALLITTISNAETRQSKDWHWDTDSKRFLYAATVNGDAQSFGQYCYLDSKNCVYLLNTKINCQTDTKLTALINSDQGAKDVELICRKTNRGDSVFVVTPFDHMDFIVRQASYFGIAIPLSNKGFQVSHFSLVGSIYAIELMRTATEKIIEIQEGSEVAPDELML